MSLWVMADLHLSFGCPKPMDRFGERWQNHADKINARWRAVVREGDTVVIPGDISWADTLDGALKDFAFIDTLPGKKLLSKGNHDYWWGSVSKMKRFFSDHGITSLDFLYNNAHAAEGAVFAGSRGWFPDKKLQTVIPADYLKLVHRERERLALSLDAAEALRAKEGISSPPIVFLHFPPLWESAWGVFRLDPLLELMLEHGVKRCYFGHIHGSYSAPAQPDWHGIRFSLISADALDFTPQLIPFH